MMSKLIEISDNEIITSDEVETYNSFEEMDINEKLLKGIYAYGFDKPSKIQAKGIKPLMSGRDIIAQSQSGTGKTGAFVIGMLQRIDPTNPNLQAILLSPTRELAKQTEMIVNKIGSYMNLKVKLIVGGLQKKNRYEWIDSNSNSCQIIVGTTGRISDELKKLKYNTDNVKIMILDEADEMLSVGFRDQLLLIFKYVPSDAQIGLFSATMPDEMLEITKKFMNDPLRILIKEENVSLEGIKQFYIPMEREHDKYECMLDLYGHLSITQTIIYVNSKMTADWLVNNLRKDGYTVDCIYGSMAEESRHEVMKGFRSGTSRILISTDLTSRGIDIQQISLVINYDIPKEKETYIHRIGRSGRFGRKGVAINFVGKNDYDRFMTIQKTYNINIDHLPSDFTNILD